MPNLARGVNYFVVIATDIAGYSTTERVEVPYGLDRQIQVTAHDRTMTAGDPIPDLTYSATPDVDFITNPSCATWANETSPPRDLPHQLLGWGG